MIRVEMQIARYSSDLESEKRTRARAHADIEARLRDIERSNWKSAGVISVVVICVNLLPLIIKSLHAL